MSHLWQRRRFPLAAILHDAFPLSSSEDSLTSGKLAANTQTCFVPPESHRSIFTVLTTPPASTDLPFISFLSITCSSDQCLLKLLLLPWTPSATVCASVCSERSTAYTQRAASLPGRRHLMRLKLCEHILMNAQTASCRRGG